MGKYAKKKTKKKSAGKGSRVMLAAAIVAVVILIALALALMWGLELQKVPELPTQTDPTQTATAPGNAEPTVPGQIYVPTTPEQTQPGDGTNTGLPDGQVLSLGKGLQITRIGSYAGIYMEDGSGEILADVLMIILENKAEQDLQLARITLEYADFAAQFEATNIPAGASVVLLEKSRHAYAPGGPKDVQLINAAFFSEPMDLLTEKLEVSGMPGALNVKNISGTDITGDIYIYYKHFAQDVYYGGVTYRTKVTGGLGAGQLQQIIAAHYDPVNCQIVAVTGGV